MIYTLTHDPQILQAYHSTDREGHRKVRLAAPRPKLWGWLDRVFDRYGAERRQVEDDWALDRMTLPKAFVLSFSTVAPFRRGG